MKILQCGQFYPPHIGGIENTTHHITGWLNAVGVRCDVLCTNDTNRSVQEELPTHTIYRMASLGVMASVAVSWPYIRKLAALQSTYDILHIHAPNPLANIALLGVRPDVKVVLHWHSDIVKQKALLKLYAPLQAWLLKRADAIIATSPRYVEGSPYLLRYREKVTVIPSATTPDSLPVDPHTVQQIRARFAGRTIVFSLGRLIYYKGFTHLIEAAKHLDDSHVILIGGDGKLRDALHAQITASKLDNKVVLLGHIPPADLGSYYEACDLLCVSSTEKSEAFGLAQIEAMSRGKPIVATNIPGSGVPWVNQHMVTGLNVPPADAAALAQAIQQISADPARYATMRANCFTRFRDYFAGDRFTADLLQLYARLVPPGLSQQLTNTPNG